MDIAKIGIAMATISRRVMLPGVSTSLSVLIPVRLFHRATLHLVELQSS